MAGIPVDADGFELTPKEPQPLPIWVQQFTMNYVWTGNASQTITINMPSTYYWKA